MNATQTASLIVEIPAYAALQREMHNALLVQHPEWVEGDGRSPMCDDYDGRFAQLLNSSLACGRAHAK